jgi:hypothetical protein
MFSVFHSSVISLRTALTSRRVDVVAKEGCDSGAAFELFVDPFAHVGGSHLASVGDWRTEDGTASAYTWMSPPTGL